MYDELEEIELRLMNYNRYQAEIELIEEEILELNEMDGLRSRRFDQMPGNGSTVSTVERTVLIKEKKLDLLNARRENLIEQQETLKYIIDHCLGRERGLVARLKYIERLSDDKVKKFTGIKGREYTLLVNHGLILQDINERYRHMQLKRDWQAEEKVEQLEKDLESLGA